MIVDRAAAARRRIQNAERELAEARAELDRLTTPQPDRINLGNIYNICWAAWHARRGNSAAIDSNLAGMGTDHLLSLSVTRLPPPFEHDTHIRALWVALGGTLG